jgi:hypothetical protein
MTPSNGQTVVVTVRGEHTAPTVYNNFPGALSSVLGTVQILCGVAFVVLGIMIYVPEKPEENVSLSVAVWVGCIRPLLLIIINSTEVQAQWLLNRLAVDAKSCVLKWFITWSQSLSLSLSLSL